jgi:hypothetical protein
VAGQAESGGFGSSHFSRKAQEAAKNRQAKHRYKGEDFPTAACHEVRAGHHCRDHYGIKQNQTDNQTCRVRH